MQMMRTPPLDTAETVARLESLVSPFGVLAAVRSVTPIPALPQLTRVISFVSGRQGGIRAYGSSFQTDRDPRIAAMAEGAERYAGLAFLDDGSVVARADELPGPALDLTTIPRCSDQEYADATCMLRPVDLAAKIRWVAGIDAATGEDCWLPAVMAHYGRGYAADTERFWYRISTGYAVHFDPAEALLRGVCEVVERDAIAVLWQQQMPLLPLADADISEETRDLISWCRRHYLHPYLFNATTDLGVPVAFCLLVAPHDENARYIVGCAAAGSLRAASEKALCEALGSREHCHLGKPVPDSPEEFTSVEDNIRFMALPQRADAYRFLLDGVEDRVPVRSQDLPEDPKLALRQLLDVFARKEIRVIVVDRTPPELTAIGLTAVNAVIPGLVPMSLHPFTRYRGHPRLYGLPSLMCFPSHPEKELNQWPLPYA